VYPEDWVFYPEDWIGWYLEATKCLEGSDWRKTALGVTKEATDVGNLTDVRVEP